MAFRPKKEDDDLDPIEIINAIRYCIGLKNSLPETGKKRNRGMASVDNTVSDYLSEDKPTDEDIDLAELFGVFSPDK